jgi:hypothetical protein
LHIEVVFDEAVNASVDVGVGSEAGGAGARVGKPETICCASGGRALWLTPIAFVSLMAVVGTLGIAGSEVPTQHLT